MISKPPVRIFPFAEPPPFQKCRKIIPMGLPMSSELRLVGSGTHRLTF